MEYKICKRCIMDTTDPLIIFDKNGYCNHCASFYKEDFKIYSKEEEDNNLSNLKKQVESGSKGKYNCIIGLSGGVDSSYVALIAKRLKLKPLLVHFDNGWNSEIAVKNIENIVKELDADLHTIVVDWEEFRNLQVAYFKADVIDIEVLSDHAIISTMYRLASKYNIKYILSGTNVSTEHILPKSWVHAKTDLWNIKDIFKKHGSGKMSSYPTIDFFRIKLYYEYFKKIQKLQPLNLINYNKQSAIDDLENELGWRNYGKKHGESLFTKFYQNYILPRKFNVDKRRAHLSSLICSGQISRYDALIEIGEPLYNPSELDSDYNYVRKKLNFSKEAFEDYFNRKPVSHLQYKSDVKLFKKVLKVKNLIKG